MWGDETLCTAGSSEFGHLSRCFVWLFPKDGAGLKDIVSVAGTAKACAETQQATCCDLFARAAECGAHRVRQLRQMELHLAGAMPYLYLVCRLQAVAGRCWHGARKDGEATARRCRLSFRTRTEGSRAREHVGPPLNARMCRRFAQQAEHLQLEHRVGLPGGISSTKLHKLGCKDASTY